jgi:hypothetical protein
VTPDPAVLATVRARLAPGTDVADALPVGRDELRRRVDELVAEGISKFVIRGTSSGGAAGEAIPEELEWLADVVLPLQT